MLGFSGTGEFSLDSGRMWLSTLNFVQRYRFIAAV
jgi:hypothetical protein